MDNQNYSQKIIKIIKGNSQKKDTVDFYWLAAYMMQNRVLYYCTGKLRKNVQDKKFESFGLCMQTKQTTHVD